jgi:hypothetical protein
VRTLGLALLTLLALAAPAAAAPEPGGTGCDPIDPSSACMLPFPSDFYTRADPTTPTGRRLDFELQAMPRNRAGKPIQPDEYNLSDGFSPGSSIVVHVPGLHSLEAFRASGLPPIDDPKRSLLRQSPVVVLDATTGERQLVWAEVDANPTTPSDVSLIVRPAKNFPEGHRIVVGLRDLRRADGTRIEAAQGFKDAVAAQTPRGEHLRERVLAPLAQEGVKADELVVAWDFTVASRQSTTGRMLHIRDQAFAELGDTDLADRRVSGRAPTFRINPDDPTNSAQTAEVDGVRDFLPCSAGTSPDCQAGESRWIARKVRGVVTVPCFLDAPGCPTTSKFAISPLNGLPVRIPGNTTAQQFTCNIPHSAMREKGAPRHRAGIYGHGLFGGQSEIDQNALQFLSDEHGFVFCAVDWKGMAFTDVPNALTILQDLSRFNTLVDHTQQGFLGFLMVGRAMLHPDGLLAEPAFRRPDGQPVYDRSELFYDGNSQGGIYGASLTAIAPDFERAVLGVPGINYSTLLTRSVDFDTYAEGRVPTAGDTPFGMYDNYPSLLERPLILAIIQTLWDRADPNGYASALTSRPLPNTPTHEVLLHVGFGDHQVADVTTEVLARTADLTVHRPVLEDGRERYSGRPYPAEPAPQAWQGIKGTPDFWPGSSVVVWDVGAPRNPAPPAANVPPRQGRDPHEDPRRTFIAIQQKSDFLRRGGVVTDVCGGPCFTRGYMGVGGL